MTLRAEISPNDIPATVIPGGIKEGNGKSGLNTPDVVWSCNSDL
jgi:hypothetical protein